MKKKIKQFIHKAVSIEVLNGVLSLLVIVLILLFSKCKRIDYSVLFSLAIVLLLSGFGYLLTKLINSLLEDDVKLTCNYENLCKTYVNKKYEFKNQNDKKNKRTESDNKVLFPIILEENLLDINIEINDEPDSMYVLPDFVQDHYDEIIKAHSSSDIYNQLNVRVKNWYMKDGLFKIDTERTTYYDSLVTNRAMDYKLECGLSVRDKLCYGPFLSSLGNSELSNHIGFNGLLETRDHYIPIIKRKKDLSIGKRVCGLSVEGSIKTKEMLKSEKEKLDIFLLIKGIRAEYYKELGIPRNDDDIKKFLEKIKSKKNRNILEKLKGKSITIEPKYKPENQNPIHGICTAYRNIVEGGKPQFFTYYTSNLSKKELKLCFKGNARANKKNLFVDGKIIGWIKVDDISAGNGFLVYNNKIICKVLKCITKKRTLKMVPSSSVCFAFGVDMGLFAPVK